MAGILTRGEVVYKCTICNRLHRTPINKHGLEVIDRCVITLNCAGSLVRVNSQKDVNATPSITPDVQGVQNWFQRRVLYIYEQPIPSNTWTVRHNLGCIPSIDVFVIRVIDEVEELVRVTPASVRPVNASTVIVSFDSPETGKLHCVAPISPTVVQQYEAVPVATATNFELTTGTSDLVIATLSDAQYVTVDLVVNLPEQAATLKYVSISTRPSSRTAWGDSEVAVINGMRYTLRSVNLKTAALASSFFTSNTIPNGSSMYVAAYNGGAPLQGEALILLSKSPHSIADKIDNQYIDLVDISNEQAPVLRWNDDIVSTTTALAVRSTYPPILAVLV